MKVSGDRKPYLQIDRVEALIAAAQVGGAGTASLELRTRTSRMCRAALSSISIPRPTCDFDDVVAAAKEMKERLEELGLRAFCKTTGGKGLHVVTPFKATARIASAGPKPRPSRARSAPAWRPTVPDKYLVNMSKDKRTGKIFLDYLRNDRMATAVAPLSPRARDGATVSMPLNWSQVKKGLDPKDLHRPHRARVAQASQTLDRLVRQ